MYDRFKDVLFIIRCGMLDLSAQHYMNPYNNLAVKLKSWLEQPLETYFFTPKYCHNNIMINITVSA